MSDLGSSISFVGLVDGLFTVGLLLAGLYVARRAARLVFGLLNAPIQHNGGFVDFPRWGGRL